MFLGRRPKPDQLSPYAAPFSRIHRTANGILIVFSAVMFVLIVAAMTGAIDEVPQSAMAVLLIVNLGLTASLARASENVARRVEELIRAR